MPYNNEFFTFFFGAGASAPFGIPTMKRMTEEFTKVVDKEVDYKERDLFHEIVNNLSKDFGQGHVDIEAIMTVIEGLKEYNADNLGELALYASHKLFYQSLLGASLKPTVEQLKTIGVLETRFQQFIRKCCRISGDHRDHVTEVYTDFFNKITKQGGNHYLSGDFAYQYYTLFTTNYDRALEAFWREDVEIDLFTGFVKKGSAPTPILDASTLRTPAQRVQLIKLHGSSTWLRNKVTGNISEEKFDIDQASEFGVSKRYDQEVTIYPLAEKQLYVEPYIQMFDCLNRELQMKNVWIVIGYSFRDSVIKNIFETHMKKGKKMLLIDPEAYQIIDKRFPKNKDNILPLPYKFGETYSFKQTNDSIISSL